MPKIFVSSVIKNSRVYRIVVDGQQRISAILSFLNNDFSLLAPYEGPFLNFRFSDLPKDVQEMILQYRIDFNEAVEYTEEELREIYSRLNKYSLALTKQELRRADFPGVFLDLAEELAIVDFLEDAKLFTVANRRRLADVEFISEILAGLIAGPQNKKEELDSFYLKYAHWDRSSVENIRSRFTNVIDNLGLLFGDARSMTATRFRQKSDFYSIFLSIDHLLSNGASLESKSLNSLQEDLSLLTKAIEPESEIPDFRTYAIRCVSQANTVQSRRWRQGFLTSILSGTFFNKPPEGDAALLFYRCLDHFFWGEPMCPTIKECSICNDIIRSDFFIGWIPSTTNFQISNAVYFHKKCNHAGYYLLNVPDANSEPNFLV